MHPRKKYNFASSRNEKILVYESGGRQKSWLPDKGTTGHHSRIGQQKAGKTTGGRDFKNLGKVREKGADRNRQGRIDIKGANERLRSCIPLRTTNGNTNPLHVVSNNVGNYRALMAA